MDKYSVDEMQLKQAYDDGYEAHNNCLDLEDNPVLPKILAESWCHGWMDAYADSK